MCSRYYIDDNITVELERLIGRMDERLKYDSMISVKRIAEKDIRPTDKAPVLEGESNSISCKWKKWGFLGFQGKKVIFNARCESAMEKPLFRDSMLHRRVVVPASWFYEWNSKKEKNTFFRKDKSILFMAGCYRQYKDGEHFVILTTQANASMSPVHDRMPLILEPEEILPWIFNDKRAEEILQKTPCLLERKNDYEQLGLF